MGSLTQIKMSNPEEREKWDCLSFMRDQLVYIIAVFTITGLHVLAFCNHCLNWLIEEDVTNGDKVYQVNAKTTMPPH